MFYLMISAVCSVAVGVLLKIFRRRQMDIRVVITSNYVIAALGAWLVLDPVFDHITPLGWMIIAGLSFLLPTVFIVYSRCLANAGIAKTDVAQRLSLFLTVLAAFFLFHESLTASKIIGIALAFIALGCLLYARHRNPANARAGDSASTGKLALALPLAGVFGGYASVDILFKLMATTGAKFPATLSLAFIGALLLMIGYCLLKKAAWRPRDLAGGAALGALNFGNIYSYIYAHIALKDTPILVFAAMNLSVIILGALTGVAIFREKLNSVNVSGILIALIAIVCLFYGK